jgi:thymidylate synthase
MMIARHTGYKPGVFSHFVANEQIYDRHMDAAEEMLKRYKEHYPEGTVIKGPKPNLVLNPEKTNFYDFTIEDFEMLCYNPIKPQLKLELGI